MVKKVSVVLLGFILFSCIRIPSQMYAKRLGDTILEKSEKTTKKSQETTTKTDSENVGRKLGGHTFPTTMLFSTPIQSSRFGFAQGGGIQSVKSVEQIGDKYIKSEEKYYGLIEGFDVGAKLHNKLSLDLKADIILSGGIDGKDFTSAQFDPNFSLKGGPVYKLYQSKKGTVITLSGRVLYSKGVNVSIQNGIEAALTELEYVVKDLAKDINYQILMEGLNNSEGIKPEQMLEAFTGLLSDYKSQVKDVFKSFTKNLVAKTTLTGFAPSLGIAHPITKWLGVQAMIEVQQGKIKKETKDIIEEYNFSQTDFNYAISINPIHSVNLVLEHIPNTLGLGLYYQGRGEIQLGLFGAKQVGSKDEKLMYGQFNITYFFSSLGRKEEQISQKETKEPQLAEEERKLIMTKHFNKGTEFIKRGKYEWAIREFQEVLKYDSNHQPSLQKIEKCKKMLPEAEQYKTEESKEPRVEVIKIDGGKK